MYKRKNQKKRSGKKEAEHLEKEAEREIEVYFLHYCIMSKICSNKKRFKK